MLPDQYGVGTVWHRRFKQRDHAFRYRLWFALIDIDSIDNTLSRSRLWSKRRFSLASLYRPDMIEPHDQSVGRVVRDRVEQVLKRRPTGQLRLLTQPRQWGLCFNPVSFYLCYDQGGKLDSIVADVHNTPWGERHAYVLDAARQADPNYEFEFDKDFHVSPFLPMNMRYSWRFKLTEDALSVHMLEMENESKSLATGLSLTLQELNRSAMRRLPLQFPLQAAKVVTGIYTHAARLWLKKVRFYPHPKYDDKHAERKTNAE